MWRRLLSHFQKQRARYFRGVLWTAGMVGLSLAVVYLLQWVLGYYEAERATIERFAILAYGAAFFVSMLSTATIFVPAPGLAIVIGLGTQFNPALVAVAAGTGAVIGELTGYYAGRLGKRVLAADEIRGYETAKRRLEKHGYWVIALFAFVPMLIFDLVGIVGGALKIPVYKFLVATWVGRVPRSFIEVYAGAALIRVLFPGWFE